MTALLSVLTVLAWGTWIPTAQAVPGAPQRTKTFYTTVGSVLVATVALLVGGGHVTFGWRGFWLPLAGGVVWTGGNYSAFRAAEGIGLARAAGSWAPLNIIVAFVWGTLLFNELASFDQARFALLGVALVLVLAGVLLIVRSQDSYQGPSQAAAAPVPSAPRYRQGLAWAVSAGILWGTYFVPAQWAKVPAQVSNFPLAVGVVAGGLALALPAHEPVRLNLRACAALVGAGVLFGTGNLALLGLVARVGTGVGFTIAQLSLLVNATIGIWVFKVPKPGSRAARSAVIGIVIAGIGGAVIGALR